jgi:hypothetical protein
MISTAEWRSKPTAYIPLLHERFQIAKCAGHGRVLKIRLVLVEKALARLGIFLVCDGVFQIRLFDGIERDDYAVDLGQGLVKISRRTGGRELHLLTQRQQPSSPNVLTSNGAHLVQIDGSCQRGCLREGEGCRGVCRLLLIVHGLSNGDCEYL